MMKLQHFAACITAVSVQISLVSFAFAADLSEGMKGLKLGLTEEKALKILEVQELQKSKNFTPYCEPDAIGKMCSIYISSLTYGNIQVGRWSLFFGSDGRLARVVLLLSVEGCVRNVPEAIPPHSQFKSLSGLLEMQYGKPSSRSGNVLVWLDRENKAGIVLGLYSQPIAGFGHPDCPITSVSLTSDEYMNQLNRPKLNGSARKNDL
jgi:hypothetical protein